MASLTPLPRILDSLEDAEALRAGVAAWLTAQCAAFTADLGIHRRRDSHKRLPDLCNIRAREKCRRSRDRD